MYILTYKISEMGIRTDQTTYFVEFSIQIYFALKEVEEGGDKVIDTKIFSQDGTICTDCEAPPHFRTQGN